MNKLTKAAIAGAAGIALLLGGAGSLALWNDTATLSGGSITAGNLKFGTATSTSWASVKGGAISDIANFRIVPGDKLTYTVTLPVAVEGDNLKANISLAAGAIQAANLADDDDVELAKLLSSSATFTALIGGASTTGSTLLLTDANDGETITVVVTIDWPSDTDGALDNLAKLGKVSLANMKIALTQVFTP